ncbi:MAG: hypothetical protein WA733_10400 [Methylocystis sp.]
MSALVLFETVTNAITGTAWTVQLDTTTPDAGETLPQSWRVRAFGDVAFHVAVHQTNTDATTGDCPVDALWQGIELVIPPGGWISVIKKTGEADGNVWLTHYKVA